MNYLHEANWIPVESWSTKRRDTSCVSTTVYGKSDISKIKKIGLGIMATKFLKKIHCLEKFMIITIASVCIHFFLSRMAVALFSLISCETLFRLFLCPKVKAPFSGIRDHQTLRKKKVLALYLTSIWILNFSFFPLSVFLLYLGLVQF